MRTEAAGREGIKQWTAVEVIKTLTLPLLLVGKTLLLSMGKKAWK